MGPAYWARVFHAGWRAVDNQFGGDGYHSPGFVAFTALQAMEEECLAIDRETHPDEPH